MSFLRGSFTSLAGKAPLGTVELYWLKEGFLPTESSYCFFCNSSRLCYNRHSHQSPPGQLLRPTSQSLQLSDSNCSQDPVRLKQSHCCQTNSQPHTPRLHKCCPPAVPADSAAVAMQQPCSRTCLSSPAGCTLCSLCWILAANWGRPPLLCTRQLLADASYCSMEYLAKTC